MMRGVQGFNRIISSVAILLSLATILDAHRQLGQDPFNLQKTEGNPLQLSPDGSFKIVLFADLHYGEDAWDFGPEHDGNSDKVISTILDNETPNFVVYLGDLITANNMATHNASLYWDKAISPTRDKGIPWATVFGNHDDLPFVTPKNCLSIPGMPPCQCQASPGSSPQPSEDCNEFRGTTRLELIDNEIEKNTVNTLSRSIKGPPNLLPSVSNYVLQISASDQTKQPAAYLYFLDSGGGLNSEVISSEQANWFKQKSEEINPDLSVPELIFWHIPSQAYSEVAPPKFSIPEPCVGSINMEDVASQKDEMGIMEAVASRPSVKAVFVGHNHGNDWCCPYKTTLHLCYARHSGYGGYGTWAKGARIIEITQQPFSIKSWIRMQDGSKHSEILLSA